MPEIIFLTEKSSYTPLSYQERKYQIFLQNQSKKSEEQ